MTQLDERSVTWAGRTVGKFGPQSASLLLAWLASHRNRLHAFLLGGKRLSVLILWDERGREAVERSEAEIDAMAVVAFGPPADQTTSRGRSVWSAEIIFTAPGDFPQRILASVEVRAAAIQAALATAARKGQAMGLDPEVVKIERTHPSWRERNA